MINTQFVKKLLERSSCYCELWIQRLNDNKTTYLRTKNVQYSCRRTSEVLFKRFLCKCKRVCMYIYYIYICVCLCACFDRLQSEMQLGVSHIKRPVITVIARSLFFLFVFCFFFVCVLPFSTYGTEVVAFPANRGTLGQTLVVCSEPTIM